MRETFALQLLPISSLAVCIAKGSVKAKLNHWKSNKIIVAKGVLRDFEFEVKG